jgi:hypothetical protein
MIPTAETYRLAEQIVLAKYNTNSDEDGQSQIWRIEAIAEHREKKTDGAVMRQFVRDIENTVDNILKQLEKKPLVVPIIPPTKKLVSTDPIEPINPQNHFN